MINRKTGFIIFLTAFALIGIAFMQAFWIKNAFTLKESQFEHRVKISLQNVVEDMRALQPDSIRHVFSSCSAYCEAADVLFNDCVQPYLLDSLIYDEFEHFDIDRHFHYGVFNKREKKVVFGSPDTHYAELVQSHHVISLSCLYRPESHFLGVYFPDQDKIIWAQMAGWLILSLVCILLMITGFSMSILSLLKQKKLSEMKADFVNNMTHEFKTPIATISIASEMLLNPEIHADPKKSARYAQIIHSENARLKSQVEQVLQIAVLDKGDYQLKMRQTDMHKIIEHSAKNFSLILKKRKGKIVLDLKAEQHILTGDRDHLTNIIMNLLDNAEKYSSCSPDIRVSTRNKDNGLLVSVEDKGIGISAENQQHIFKQLYRVPTGNVHDVKGFGLGLFYVKTMVEAHGGTIELTSEVKRGSRFDLFFPFNQPLNNEQEQPE